MLDSRTIKILEKISLTCKEGYAVVTTDELTSDLPKNLRLDAFGVTSVLEHLEKEDYIKVKFSEGRTFCLAPLPKGRLVLEEASLKTRGVKTLNKYLGLSLVASLVGGFIGGVLASLFRELLVYLGWL